VIVAKFDARPFGGGRINQGANVSIVDVSFVVVFDLHDPIADPYDANGGGPFVSIICWRVEQLL